MDYPVVHVVHNRRKNGSESVPAAVELDISFQRKQKRFSTGVSVTTLQWDEKKHVIKRPDAALLNLQIDAYLQKISALLAGLMAEHKSFTWDCLDLLFGKIRSSSFVDYVAERISSRSDIQDITRKSHHRLINALEAFRKISTFDDLTQKNIKEFDKWLHAQGYVQTSVACFHKFMKTYINLAISEDILDHNPYQGIRIDKGKSRARKFLSDEELQAVRDLQTDDPSTMRARDLFLFQCFTGLAYVDLERFDFSKIEERGGKYVMRDERKKTGNDFYIVLLSPAVEILKKYDFKLPVISNQKYNYALKAVAAGAGIRFSLTSHMGRHTFATYCLNRGIPIETLATMMGHSDVRSTQIYAKIVNKTVENAFGMLEASLTD